MSPLFSSDSDIESVAGAAPPLVILEAGGLGREVLLLHNQQPAGG